MDLHFSKEELNSYPKHLAGVAEAMTMAQTSWGAEETTHHLREATRHLNKAQTHYLDDNEDARTLHHRDAMYHVNQAGAILSSGSAIPTGQSAEVVSRLRDIQNGLSKEA